LLAVGKDLSGFVELTLHWLANFAAQTDRPDLGPAEADYW